MSEQQSYLIIGNGIAGATAAEILRTEDSAAEITVIAEDPFPVYYRPALKDYLGGKVREDKLWARPISFYQDRRVRFLTDKVVGIQGEQHSVQLLSGGTVGYFRLLLAHGARASTLSVPGIDLDGVTTLRTVADYQKVLGRLNKVRRVVVTGSGTLALESIETLRHRGFQVTHLLRRRSLWSEVLDPTASDLVLQQEKRDGIDVRYEQEIAELTGRDGQVTGVITTTGVHIPCELVLLGIGIDPIIDFVKSAGVACGRGVKVDGGMCTNTPDIYAAGDLVETADSLTGRSRVIGQWYPSIQQARAAAYSMLGLLDTRYEFRFGNFFNATFLYGLEFASVGLSNIPKDGKGYQEIAADPQPRTYQKVILKDGIPVGVLALGDRKTVLTFKRAIDHNVDLSPVASRLFSPDFKLGEWLDKRHVPSPILGVSREGTVSIKQAVYAGMKARLAILKPQALNKAVLVPVAPPEIKSALGETYLSQTKVVTVGRHEGAGLPINHNSISRRQAEISYANGQYVLRDLQSTNGTFVNDQRLEPGSVHILKPDDEVRFGRVTFALRVREVDAFSSIPVHKQSAGVSLPFPRISAAEQTDLDKDAIILSGEAAIQRSENGGVAVAAEQGHPVMDEVDETAKTIQVKAGLTGVPLGGTQSSERLPVLNSDGSLLLSGVTSAVPANVVSTLKDTPAFVAIVQGKPVVFLLKQGQRFILGRDKGSHIVLADVSVSRKHAEAFPGPDGFYIRDLASSNGVLVNQTLIDNPYRLSHGDCITLGNSMLYFVDQRPQTPVNVGARFIAPQENSGGKAGVGIVSQAFAPEARQSGRCDSCGAVSNGIARFCPSCGAPL